MRSEIRSAINQANARESAGPVTSEGKSAPCLNAFKHGLTGQRVLLQEHELEAYRRLGAALHAEHSPNTETERQLVQKIVDCHARLNRIAALDGNLLNVSFAENTAETFGDERVKSIVVQVRAFTAQSRDFDNLGRYESRIVRQLMQYTKELARVQDLRQPRESKSVDPELASFVHLSQSEPATRTVTAAASPLTSSADPATVHASVPA